MIRDAERAKANIFPFQGKTNFFITKMGKQIIFTSQKDG